MIAYPGQVTRVVSDVPEGRPVVWHCHIVEHEDNEMMRPFTVGPLVSPTSAVLGAAEADGGESNVFLPEIRQ